jgi:hypothetical protein
MMGKCNAAVTQMRCKTNAILMTIRVRRLAFASTVTNPTAATDA